MLFAIGAFFIVLWVVALALKVTTGLIHLALVAAVLFWVFGFFRGRRTAT